MALPVLTAVSGAVWESLLVAALEREDLGVVVVRRCVDLADLLATASTGQARAVLLSADLRRLDRDALARLAVARVAVVGLVTPGDEAAANRLRQLGVAMVLPSDAPAGRVSAAVVEVVEALARPSHAQSASVADPLAALPESAGTSPADGLQDPPTAPTGQVIAVWGPTGAPGRTTVAIAIAAEVAALERTALLIDADVYGGVVAQVLGLLDESPGLAATCRLANAGTLDLTRLTVHAREVGPLLRVLTGIARADRWPEIRPASIEVVLTLARSLASATVVDCGFCLEQDEELSYDTAAPRRNGATLAVLEEADTVLAVGSADPVGLQRLIRGLSVLREMGVQPRVVINRLRSTAIPGDAEREVRGGVGALRGRHRHLGGPGRRAGAGPGPGRRPDPGGGRPVLTGPTGPGCAGRRPGRRAAHDQPFVLATPLSTPQRPPARLGTASTARHG